MTTPEPENQAAPPAETDEIKSAPISSEEFEKLYQTGEKISEQFKNVSDENKDLGIGLGGARCSFIFNISNNIKNQFNDEVEIGGNLNAQDGSKSDQTITYSDFNYFLSKVALSVLSGSRSEVFFEESRKLKLLVAQHQTETANLLAQENTRAVSDDFFSSEDNLLEKLEAIEEDSEENTEYGATPVKLLRSLDENKQDSILLEQFWRIRLNLRAPFLQWLVSLGNHKSVAVRIKAADTLGKIICFDKTSFDLIIRNVLAVWAVSPNPSVKRLVGRTLSLVIGDSEEEFLSPQVLRLLHVWITQKNDVRLRHTATLVLYSDIGLRFPGKAMEFLDKVTLNEDFSLFFPIAETMSDLFEAGEQQFEMYQIVLNTLGKWSKEKKKSMRYQVSQIILWAIMRQEITVREDTYSRWITLLRLIKSDRELFGSLIRNIFRQSLFGEKSHLDLIFGEMRKWLESSLKNEDQYAYLRLLFYEILYQGTEQEAKRLLSYLLWWRNSFKMEAAKRIISEFAGKEVIGNFAPGIRALLQS